MPSDIIETDALIIGAGPAGLFQAFQLGLLEIGSHIVDSLPYPGGQCIELYPDKPIYDIPGLPRCTGRELVARLIEQLAPFSPPMHLQQQVSRLEPQADGRFLLETSTGMRFASCCVFIAAGVGAFQPRLLNISGLEALRGHHVFYQAERPRDLAGKAVLVVGGDDAALQCVCELAGGGSAGDAGPLKVILLHRRSVYQAAPALVEKVDALAQAGAVTLRIGQITGFSAAGGKLGAVEMADSEGQLHTLPADVLLAFLGLSPRLGPLADWGLALERKQLLVDTEQFSTSIPGIFAIGDINTYPGKKKLILSAFHECALAAFGAAARVFPDRKTQLQYTTTSTRLHSLLGVANDRELS